MQEQIHLFQQLTGQLCVCYWVEFDHEELILEPAKVLNSGWQINVLYKLLSC